MEKNLTKWPKDSKAFRLFVDELRERLSQLDYLQKASPENNQELLNNAKTGFHQTKGAAGMFGYDDLAEQIYSEFSDFRNKGYGDVFVTNTYSPSLSKDPYGDVLSSLQDRSRQHKIA